jgi:hypothetical protein
MTDEEEMCSSGSSWPLSISTDEEHGREDEAITLREAVAARKTRIPNPEALSRSDSSISLRIPEARKKDRNRYNVRMRPLYDSKIVTFSEESELHIKLPRTSLKKSLHTVRRNCSADSSS